MLQFQSKYNQQYDLLNAEQKKAVDTIYGPVLVIAGPGTGKTQILSLRVANLLQSEAQVAPYNILCLTFTDEGKKNMRDRLIKLIGAETAQHIAIHTFHSFCNEVIQMNLNLFQQDSLDAVSELEKIQYIKEILLQLDKKHPLYNGKKPTIHVRYLLNLFSKMKQENWTADYLHEKTQAYIDNLKADPDNLSSRGKTKGQLKVEVMNKIKSFEKSLAGIKLFESYKNVMLQHQRYDFDDMINWVIRLFKTHEDVLLGYQEKYQYILADEFQDTNGSQLELMYCLSNYDDSPNLFVVGDDDQSIYRFQGASIENMSRFRQKYIDHGLVEICLRTNYRSTQGILQYAKNLIDKVENRLIHQNALLDKNLISFYTAQHQHDTAPQFIRLYSDRHEKIYLAKKIQELIEQGVPPQQIAVLYAENKNCLELASYLKKLDIPYYTRKRVNLLQDITAAQILQILRYIHLEFENPYSADDLLFEILHYDFFHIPALLIAKTSILSSQFASSHKSQKNSFRLYLQEALKEEAPTLFVASERDALLHASRILENLIHSSANISVLQLLDAVVEQCDILTNILADTNKFEKLESLTALFDFIKDECHRNPTWNLHSIMQLIDLMVENDIEIPLTKIYGHENAVRLFTIHSSKGHEYEYVFVAGCVAEQWESKRKPSSSVQIPPNVFESAVNTKDADELRRLMYVALTRAKKHLTVSYYDYDNKEKDCTPSILLYQIFENEIEPQKPNISNEDILFFESLTNNIDEKIIATRMEKAFVDKQLEHFEMSATALNNYLRCPLHFYYQNILRIPSGVSEAMTFGTCIHYALEKIMRDMKADPTQAFPPVERLIDHFEFYMRRNKEKFSNEGFQHKLSYGNDLLTEVYNHEIIHWSKQVVLEEHVKATIKGIPIKGFMDKIEYHEQGDIVVDYKTGDPSKAKKKFDVCDPIKENIGGDYWRQAIFYKLLLDYQHPRKYKSGAAQFLFIEPNSETKQLVKPVTVVFSKQQEAYVIDQITSTWEKIHQHQFYEGCGDKYCDSCNLTKKIQTIQQQ